MYSPEEKALIKARYIKEAKEGRSQSLICEDPDMPAESTIREWLNEDPEFSAQSAHARALTADRYDQERNDLCNELVEIAKESVRSGTPVPRGVVEAYKAAMQEKARSAALRDDSRYGDRKHVALSGDAEGAPIRVKRELPPLTPEQIFEMIKLKNAGRSKP